MSEPNEQESKAAETRPVIGINASVVAGGAGELPAITTRVSYVDAVTAAGGVPVILPAGPSDESLDRQVALCDGFVFVGGPDMNPRRYGVEVPEPTVTPMHPRREDYDLRLIDKVMATRKPFLAVCLGCQEVNVALGGTLIQDISSETDTNVPHTKQHAPYFARQEVMVEGGTLMSRLVGAGRLNANTAHHQAIKEPGKGLKISSRCEADGIIESCEVEDYPFGLAVQWHPEMLAHEESHLALFKGLVRAARGETV